LYNLASETVGATEAFVNAGTFCYDPRLPSERLLLMWAQYRKTALATQMFILVMCALAYFFGKAPVRSILTIFVVMQICGLLGAWWGTRLKARIEKSELELPLERR
jgi:hypothetical protein